MSFYEEAFAAHTDIVQRAFTVAAMRLEARGLPIHHILIGGVQYLKDGVQIGLVVHVDDSEQTHRIRVSAAALNAVEAPEVEAVEARVAQLRFLEDQEAYNRVVNFSDLYV